MWCWRSNPALCARQALHQLSRFPALQCSLLTHQFYHLRLTVLDGGIGRAISHGKIKANLYALLTALQIQLPTAMFNPYCLPIYKQTD